MEPAAELRDYFETSPVALSLAAAEGDHPLLLTNGRFRDLTGYASGEVIGRNCRFLQREGDNRAARARIHEFLAKDHVPNVRCEIVNFRKDGTPFVNLLYMSKLRDLAGQVRFLFASQFDISRTRPALLAEYDEALDRTLTAITPIVAERGLIIEGSLITIANSVAAIAQARLTLAHLDAAAPE